jgi:CubicO group peptidase (beta-lactamase class C family)
MRKLIILIYLLPTLLSAQKNYPALMDKYMQAQVKTNEFTGTVLVSQKGKIIYEKAFGMADREWNVLNTIQSKFQIGSITKQFTAACILQLVNEGKMSLDDKLSKYFPDFPKADSVTIHMLLTHTSGLKNYTELEEFWKIMTLPIQKDSMVSIIKRQPFDFSPGTSWHYSNSGYFLLGYIIEKVSALSYSEYLLKNVIQKAGLKNTSVNRWDTILANRAKGYQKTPNGWINAFYISMEAPYSAGAIISNVEDLYQWNNALFSNKIIPPALFNKMITPYKEHYGFGLGIDSFHNHPRIGHGGGIPGFLSYLARFPSDDIVVAGLSNNGNSSPEGIVNTLAAILFDLPVIDPYKHKEVKIDSMLLAKYEGRYKYEPASKADTIIAKQGKLYYRPWWGGEYQMRPESNTVFFLEDNLDMQFEFDVDDKGRIIKIYVIENGIKTEIKKV